MSEQEIDYEAIARKEGWRPESEWKGENKPAEFIDAKTFVENGDNIAGMLKKKVTALESTVENLQSTNSEFRQYHERTLEKERREREAEIAQLKKDRQEAISEGDGQRFTMTDDRLTELQSQEPVDPNAGMDQLAVQWLDSNSWYKTNEKLAAYADGIADRVTKQGYTGQAYFNELTRRVEDAFPDEFSKPVSAQVVEGGQVSQVTPESQTYEDLPAEAKAECDRFVRDIPGFTKDNFVANYDWD